MSGSGEPSHRESLKTRRRALPEPTEGEPQAVERQMGGARFGASTMAVMVQQPDAQGSLIFAHQR